MDTKSKDVNAAGVFERKLLRTMFGAIEGDNVYRKRYNDKLYKVYADEDIISNIKKRRLRCLGHMKKIDGTRMPLTILNTKPREKRRPRL